MKSISFILALFIATNLLGSVSVHAESIDAKRSMISELIKMQGATSDDIIRQIIQDQRTQRPKMPESYFKKFESKLQSVYKGYEDKMIQQYIASFSEQTLKDTLAFYKTKSGQDFVQTSQKLFVLNQEILEKLNADIMSTVLEMIDDQQAQAEPLKKAQ